MITPIAYDFRNKVQSSSNFKATIRHKPPTPNLLNGASMPVMPPLSPADTIAFLIKLAKKRWRKLPESSDRLEFNTRRNTLVYTPNPRETGVFSTPQITIFHGKNGKHGSTEIIRPSLVSDDSEFDKLVTVLKAKPDIKKTKKKKKN